MPDPKTVERPPLPPAESADDILDVQDVELLPVEVPEWKRTVYLRTLPADEGLKINDKMQALPEGQKAEAIFILLSETLVTATGAKLFTTTEQYARLHSRSNKVLMRLQKQALRLQGWLDEGSAKNA